MSRRNRERSGSMFQKGEQDTSPQSVSDNIFGDALRKADSQQVRALPIPIMEIHPNPEQPRRSMPAPIRAQWDGTPRQLDALFDVWIAGVHSEREAAGEYPAFALEARLEAQDGAEPPQTPGTLENALTRLILLAASIKRDGLTNPITVTNSGLHYLIETGENRWLAFHLLHKVYGEAWEQIPAREVEQFDLWRQATENNARNDLNAIAKARQFALLLMDLLAQDGHTFQPFSTFEQEQDFYAQVADGDQFTIPYGKSGDVVNAMGLKNAVQLRQYRSLLRLPNELWTHADDNNLTEFAIREIARQAEPVTPVTGSKSSASQATPIEKVEKAMVKERERYQRILKRTRKAEQRVQIIALMREQAAWLLQQIEMTEDEE